MRIILNGKPQQVSESRLDAVLLECGYDQPAIATAVNQAIVHAEDRAQTSLQEGDQLEVLAPIGGG
tara:strand:- start:9 stop:206 length:198 start_codon:yes stop_codon:yes gene_type:complete